ncbi:ribose 5-phosphate isomerase B [candidate division KSB1 bacterium]
MKIVIGSDHAGFELKQNVVKWLIAEAHDVTDVGADSEDSVDYPDFGYKAAREVAHGEYDRGVLICGSGIGMSIVANKVAGIRAALCITPEVAELSRSHNNANILILAGRMTDKDTACEIVSRWLHTDFEGGRHARRIDKIHNLTGI